MPSRGREWGDRRREGERGQAHRARLRGMGRAEGKREKDRRGEAERKKKGTMRDERRLERERPVRASYKIVVQRPTRNLLLLLHRRTDERTDGRINRGSHLLFTCRVLCTRANARGPLCGDDIGYRARRTGVGGCDRLGPRSWRGAWCKGVFISLTHVRTIER